MKGSASFRRSKKSFLMSYLDGYWQRYFAGDLQGVCSELMVYLCSKASEDSKIRGRYIFVSSSSQLCKECHCSWRKMTYSLEVLQTKGFIQFVRDGRKTVITLCVSANNLENSNKEKDETKDKKKESSPCTPIKEEKKEKKEEKEKRVREEISHTRTLSPFSSIEETFPEIPVSERRQNFLNSIRPFVAQYGRDMCNDFFTTWSELTPEGDRMRFELERTWEVGKRLSKWRRYEGKLKVSSGQKREKTDFESRREEAQAQEAQSKYNEYFKNKKQ